jgi:lysylphosphatidylglycerol synthetase-like protein (DUF2156 family)
MADFRQYLQSQREAALRLILQHNRILASAFDARDDSSGCIAVPTTAVQAMTATTPDVVSVSTSRAEVTATTQVQHGKVIQLFEYRAMPPSAQVSVAEAAAAPVCGRVFCENDAAAMAEWKVVVDSLLAQYGGDDALAINRKQMADTIFLAEGDDAIFYHKSVDGVMFVTCYVGPEARYDAALAAIVQYAAQHSLIINIMAQEDRVAALQAAGLSTTPIGIWQRIDPVSEFSTGGTSMRRLRYLVSKYEKLDKVRTEEYVPGTDGKVDKAICEVMDAWVVLKKAHPPFVAQVQSQVMAGTVSSDHRFFLTWRGDKLDNVIVLSRDNRNNGYLMDLEFYAEGLPLGSTEYALTQILEVFRNENRKVLSLGLTMGTGLFEHANQSQEVYDLFQSLKKAEYLNGDANAQYKNKYRPQSVPMYIARPQGCGRKKLNDLMMILGAG